VAENQPIIPIAVRGDRLRVSNGVARVPESRCADVEDRLPVLRGPLEGAWSGQNVRQSV